LRCAGAGVPIEPARSFLKFHGVLFVGVKSIDVFQTRFGKRFAHVVHVQA
jgi:hypothetical protein